MTNATHTVIKVMAKPVFMLQRLPICGQRVGSFTRWFLIAAFIAYFGYNFYCSYYRNQPSSVFQWDYLLLTGIATLWFGLTVVASVDQDFEGMIARLIERGILPEATDHLSLMQLLRDNASRTARIFSLLCALAMLIAFAVATFFDPNYGKLLLAVPASIASYIAGSYLGRMVSYGGLAKQLLHEGLQIEIFPEHVDGVGGLKPVGDFYLLIKGDIGPRGDAYKPEEALDVDTAYSFHSPQIKALASSGVDYLQGSTLPALSERLGIALVMAETGLPYVISFVVDRTGCLLDGTKLTDAISRIDDEVGANSARFAVNCVHPRILHQALDKNPGIEGRIISFHGNTADLSAAELDGSEELITEEPVAFSRAYKELLSAHDIKIIGGCCGSNPDHIGAIAKVL